VTQAANHLATQVPCSLRGVYAITPDELMLPRLLSMVQAALDGGVRIVQYRNKSASAELRRVQARAVMSVCRLADACFIVNDDIELALALGADGVHVGKDDVALGAGDTLADVRAALGPGRILGVTCYHDTAIAQAASVCADYLAVGSLFASPSKPHATPASLAFVTEIKQRFGLPVCGIGGITLENAPLVIEAGADMVAVISALFDAPDVCCQAQHFQQLFEQLPSFES
jgi:thiamine-phosphate pyrophosphorylase